MSARTWFTDTKATSQGLVYGDFSFLTNNTSDPAVSSFRGCGGLTGVDGTLGNANTGPSAVASIIRVGQGVGTFLVTLADSWRQLVTLSAAIDDNGDALAATTGTITNEGSGNGGPAVTFKVFIRNAGALAETTGRRISVYLTAKDSGNGA